MIAILIAALCVLIVVLIAVLVGAADTVHHHKTDAAHYRQLYDDAVARLRAAKKALKDAEELL